MPQISTGKLREWSIFEGDNRSDKTDNSGYCPIWNRNVIVAQRTVTKKRFLRHNRCIELGKRYVVLH